MISGTIAAAYFLCNYITDVASGWGIKHSLGMLNPTHSTGWGDTLASVSITLNVCFGSYKQERQMPQCHRPSFVFRLPSVPMPPVDNPTWGLSFRLFANIPKTIGIRKEPDLFTLKTCIFIWGRTLYYPYRHKKGSPGKVSPSPGDVRGYAPRTKETATARSLMSLHRCP